MSQKVWEINGISLPLDLEDAEVMERVEDAFDAMEQEEKQIPKDGKKSVRIRSYCYLFRNLFDHIFGEGTSEQIFKDMPMTAAVHSEAYLSFLEFIRAQRAEAAQAAQECRERLNKYRPNRRQRRAAEKHT